MAPDERKVLSLLDMSVAFDCIDQYHLHPALASTSRGWHWGHCARLDPVVSQWTHTAGRVRRRAIGYVGGAVRRSTEHGTRTTAEHPLHGSTVQHHRATSGQRPSIRRRLATVSVRAAGGRFDR